MPGADMTVEAALTKLSYLFGQGLPPAEVNRLVQLDLRGELTQKTPRREFSLRQRAFVKTVARVVRQTSGAPRRSPNDGVDSLAVKKSLSGRDHPSSSIPVGSFGFDIGWLSSA